MPQEEFPSRNRAVRDRCQFQRATPRGGPHSSPCRRAPRGLRLHHICSRVICGTRYWLSFRASGNHRNRSHSLNHAWWRGATRRTPPPSPVLRWLESWNRKDAPELVYNKKNVLIRPGHDGSHPSVRNCRIAGFVDGHLLFPERLILALVQVRPMDRRLAESQRRAIAIPLR